MARTSVAPKPEAWITQAAMAKLMRDQERLARAKAQATELEAEVKKQEKDLLALFDTKAEIEAGEFTSAVRTTERRNVAWKEAFEKACGPEAAAAVHAQTTPTITRHVIVSKAGA